MKEVTILINSNEFQSKILDCIYSEELDKWINSSVYSDDKNAKGAIMYGMTLAALQTCRCQQYLVSEKDLEKPEVIRTILRNIDEIEMIIDTVCNTSGSHSLQDGDIEALQHRLDLIKGLVTNQK